MRKHLIGVDIGGTKCAVILADGSNGIRLLKRTVFATDTEKGFHYTLDRLLEEVREMLACHNLVADDLLGIGISCGGPLDSRRGLVLSPPNLPGWDNVPLVQLFEEAFGVTTFIQNDANACALAEWKLGAGRGVEDMVFLTMGTGFGAGIIAEGRLIRGQSDMGGEVGHVRLEAEGPVGFGKAGSMEGYCSGAGIATQAHSMTDEWMKTGHVPIWVTEGIPLHTLNVKVLADYAGKGDPDALAVFTHAGGKLGAALSVLMDILNPARIIIGSIFVHCESFLRPEMERVIGQEALIHARRVCEVLPAQLGETLGDYAAILTACHGLGLQVEVRPETSSETRIHLTQLIERYPDLTSLTADIEAAFQLLADTFRAGGKLLICGNGGSAADSDHIVGELMKGFYKNRPLPPEIAARLGAKASRLQGALPAISLTGHAALSSAFGNDVDPGMIFAQQVFGYGRPGDCFLGISTSGSSLNVVAAAETAKTLGLRTLCMTGPKGGKLEALCDVTLKVPGSCTAEVQERHLPLYHTLCAMLEETFFPG